MQRAAATVNDPWYARVLLEGNPVLVAAVAFLVITLALLLALYIIAKRRNGNGHAEERATFADGEHAGNSTARSGPTAALRLEDYVTREELKALRDADENRIGFQVAAVQQSVDNLTRRYDKDRETDMRAQNERDTGTHKILEQILSRVSGDRGARDRT